MTQTAAGIGGAAEDAPGDNALTRRMARGSVTAFAVFVASAGLAYATQLAIARSVGADGYGIYAYVLAWMTVAAYFSALGFDVSLLRFVPAYRAQRRYDLERGIVRFAGRLVGVMSVGVALVLAGGLLARRAALPPQLAETFLVGCVLVPVWALLWVRSSTARAYGGVVGALAPERIGRDGLLLVALLLAGPGLGLVIATPAVMGLTLASSLVALLLADRAARSLQPAAPAGLLAVSAHGIWLRAAVPLVLIGTVEPLMNRSGVMLLGWLGTVRDAGIFAAAFNIAFLTVLPRTAVNALFAPAASHLFTRGDHAGLQALIARTGIWTLLGAIGLAVPLWLLAAPLLAWFGHDFTLGAPALRVLLLGQVFAAATGSQLPLLTMTGHERAAAVLLGASVVIGCLVGAVLIGPLGLTGAAIGTTTALVLWNAAMAVFIWRSLRLLPGVTAALRPRPRGIGAALVRWVACAALLPAIGPSRAAYYPHMADAHLIADAAMPEPGYLQPAIDPAFGTRFIRVTDPGHDHPPGLHCRPRYCTHRYSSDQAWNADQSLLVIVNGCGGFCFLDGHSFKPLFARRSPDQCEWHPHDPTLMICVSPSRFYAWHPRSDMRTTIDPLPGYHALQFGPYKGNLSNDGRRLVLRAVNSAGALVAFAYDIPTRTRFPEIALGRLSGANGFCGISASGRYVFCFQEMPDTTNQAYVFTVDGRQVQHWTENHRPGHGDMTIDADGSDVYVGISKAAPDAYHVIKRRLRDGAVTDLAPYGEATHASIRNIDRSGWVFVTYSGTHAELARHPAWAPFESEVIALRIDGSGTFRPIVQTHDAKAGYWSEAHASPSPDGSQVIWSSNWGRSGGPVADYVAQVEWNEAATASARPLPEH